MTFTPLDHRTIDFLSESNAIENITEIDYTKPENRKEDQGHYGALIRVKNLAIDQKQLTLEELCRWQALLTEEQTLHGHPLLRQYIGQIRGPENPVDVRVGTHVAMPYNLVEASLKSWLAHVNHDAPVTYEISPQLLESIQAAGLEPYQVLGTENSSNEFIQIAADALQQFEAIHPFVDGNGRVGRLIVNYIALLRNRPIFVFRQSERDAFFAAHRSKRAMRCFIAEKTREAYNWFGELALRQSSSGFTDLCVTESGKAVCVERHELADVLERWQREDAERNKQT